MPAPSDQSCFRSLLGFVYYYGDFVHELSKMRARFDALLEMPAFDHVKEILESNLLLTHYDPTKEIIVAADSSNHGVGTVIVHLKSRFFLSALFYRMIHGRKFTLLTDHKSLVVIFGSKKGAPRSQPAILKQLHQGHPGIVQMKAIARSCIWWAGMGNEIETVVRSCDKCAAVCGNPSKN
ncbi:hypothetical protein TTRE_0000894701 [Trichuris trichiura]|uniref:RNA-directed DNA polymerase n=1 Tax=Trichuris trichiura TaxID=36087 RepID=A0A077ZLG5_TRITR|nr:hypothetical protein TTRE_0000894701 [Trichuris trichiura]